MRWDIFCTVIDNYGDIGIAWRLARQLAREHGLETRLWVDDLTSFARIRPEVDPVLETQEVAGVRIRLWRQPFPEVEPADVVVEALACHLPDNYVAAMARRPRPSVWINLEYLSAEDWVAGCHALPSPHPRLPLTKYFYFPGWGPGSGGILREQGLLENARAFQATPRARRSFWSGLGLPMERDDEIRISMFCYANPGLAPLMEGWAAGQTPVRCLFPCGPALPQLTAYFGVCHAAPYDTLRRGQLTTHILPMLSQDDYDRLLWACDCNFVRGEDSFTRAQWARRPLVWQAYPQAEGAHWAKIAAFVQIYRQGLDAEAGAALEDLWNAWNAGTPPAAAWERYWRCRDRYTGHAEGWAEQVAGLGDLAANLVQFCKQKL